MLCWSWPGAKTSRTTQIAWKRIQKYSWTSIFYNTGRGWKSKKKFNKVYTRLTFWSSCWGFVDNNISTILLFMFLSVKNKTWYFIMYSKCICYIQFALIILQKQYVRGVLMKIWFRKLMQKIYRRAPTSYCYRQLQKKNLCGTVSNLLKHKREHH